MILTGIMTGLVCVGLNKGVSLLIKFRNSTMAHLVDSHESVAPAFLMNITYGVSLTSIGAIMVCPHTPNTPNTPQCPSCHLLCPPHTTLCHVYFDLPAPQPAPASAAESLACSCSISVPIPAIHNCACWVSPPSPNVNVAG